MHFEISADINRPPSDVFAFLRDKDKYPQKKDSPVLVLEQITPGPASVGTQYREIVRMLPFVRGEVLSEITRFEPGAFLEEDFKGPGFKGHLAYEFIAHGTGTKITQRQIISPSGFLKVFAPLIKIAFLHRMKNRLEQIKILLESGWRTDTSVTARSVGGAHNR